MDVDAAHLSHQQRWGRALLGLRAEQAQRGLTRVLCQQPVVAAR